MKLASIFAAILAGTLVVVSYAMGAGPSPGLDSGIGVKRPGAAVRFVALPAGRGTLVEAVRVDGGSVLRSRYLKGRFGVPLVTYGGDTGGLARRAARLVLASESGAGPQVTRFVILRPRTLKVRKRVAIRGSFAFDALSPDGSLMYLLQFGTDAAQYKVRAFNLDTLRLYPGAIVDRREPDEKMTGVPVTRVESRDGGWAYTLYSRGDRRPFVHALDTVHSRAFCVDVPLPASAKWLWDVRMRVDSRRVVLRHGRKTVASFDTKTFEVSRR